MKKIIALLLAVLTAFSCLAVAAFAEEPEIEKTPSGLYVGQVLAVGDIVESFYKVESCIFSYVVNEADVEKVTSEMSDKYADSVLAQFRDNIAGFQVPIAEEGLYEGKYTIKGVGSLVGEMKIGNDWCDATQLLDENEKKKNKKEINITIDYEYVKDTMLQYTTISGWKIISVLDDNMSLRVALEAVWSTREPTAFEAFGEKVYAAFMKVHDAFLDVLGDTLIVTTPKFLDAWAKLLSTIMTAIEK